MGERRFRMQGRLHALFQEIASMQDGAEQPQETHPSCSKGISAPA